MKYSFQIYLHKIKFYGNFYFSFFKVEIKGRNYKK